MYYRPYIVWCRARPPGALYMVPGSGRAARYFTACSVVIRYTKLAALNCVNHERSILTFCKLWGNLHTGLHRTGAEAGLMIYQHTQYRETTSSLKLLQFTSSGSSTNVRSMLLAQLCRSEASSLIGADAHTLRSG